jgi:hypothetical protein
VLSWPTGDPAILSARRSVLIAPNPGAKADMPRGPRWVQELTSRETAASLSGERNMIAMKYVLISIE